MATRTDDSYPVRFDVQYPESLSRLTFLKWLLAIPHLAFVSALNGVWEILSFIAAVAILFTGIYAGIMVLISGKYPEGVFKFVVGVQRWSLRTTTYAFFMHDAYPPFSLDP